MSRRAARRRKHATTATSRLSRQATHHAVRAVFPANVSADHHHQRPAPVAKFSSATISSARADKSSGAKSVAARRYVSPTRIANDRAATGALRPVTTDPAPSGSGVECTVNDAFPSRNSCRTTTPISSAPFHTAAPDMPSHTDFSPVALADSSAWCPGPG